MRRRRTTASAGQATPHTPPEALRWMLSSGYRGWVQVRTSHKPNAAWSKPGVVVEHDDHEMVLARDDAFWDRVTISYRYVTGVRFLVDPVEHPVPDRGAASRTSESRTVPLDDATAGTSAWTAAS